MNGHNPWFEAVGLIASVFTTSAFLPQAIRIWRNRSARDISLVMYLMLTTGTALWLAYGALIASLSLVIANLTSLVMVASVLGLKIHDMLRPRNLLVEIVAAEAGPVTEVVHPVNSNDAPANSKDSRSAVPPAAE